MSWADFFLYFGHKYKQLCILDGRVWISGREALPHLFSAGIFPQKVLVAKSPKCYLSEGAMQTVLRVLLKPKQPSKHNQMNLSGGDHRCLEKRWVSDSSNPITEPALLFGRFEPLPESQVSSRWRRNLEGQDEAGTALVVQGPHIVSVWPLTSHSISRWHEQKESWTPDTSIFILPMLGQGWVKALGLSL